MSVTDCCLSSMAISRDSFLPCFILTIPLLNLPFWLPYCFDWCWSLSWWPNSSQGSAGGVLKSSSNSRFRSLNRNILQAAHFSWEKLGVGVLADTESRQFTVGPNVIEVLGSQYCWYSSSGGGCSQETSKEIFRLANMDGWCTCCMKLGGEEVPSGETGAQAIVNNMLKSTSWKIISMTGHKLLAPSPGSFQLVPVEIAPEGFWSSWGHTLMWPWKYMQPSCSSTTISVTDEVSAAWWWMESLYISWIFQVTQLLFVQVQIESSGIMCTQFVIDVMTGFGEDWGVQKCHSLLPYFFPSPVQQQDHFLLLNANMEG